MLQLCYDLRTSTTFHYSCWKKQRGKCCQVKVYSLPVTLDSFTLSFFVPVVCNLYHCMTLPAFSHSRGDPEEPFKLNSTVAPGATRTLKPYDAESTIGKKNCDMKHSMNNCVFGTVKLNSASMLLWRRIPIIIADQNFPSYVLLAIQK